MKDRNRNNTVRGLHADPPIMELLDVPEFGLPESRLLSVLSKYDCEEALLLIAEESRRVAHDGEVLGHKGVALHDKDTGALVYQYGLAYLANAFMRSTTRLSGDRRGFSIHSHDNIVALSKIVVTRLEDPVESIDPENFSDTEFSTTFLRLALQQMSFQGSPMRYIGRTWAIFGDLLSRVDKYFASDVEAHFQSISNGVSIRDYLGCAIGIIATAQSRSIIEPRALTDSEVRAETRVFDPHVVMGTLTALSASIAENVEEDSRLNEGLLDKYTKYRLNPLWRKPILRLGSSSAPIYVVANTGILAAGLYTSLYWQIHRAYEKEDKALHFRRKFGAIVNSYCGELLTRLREPGSVLPEFPFGGKKRRKDFIDWWYLEESPKKRLFMFEVKSSQLNRTERQTAEMEGSDGGAIDKITDAILQLYKLREQIKMNPEQRMFKGYELMSFVFTYDVPWVSAGFLNDYILAALRAKGSEKDLHQLDQFPVSIIDLEDLERCHWDYLSQLGGKPIKPMREALEPCGALKLVDGYTSPYLEESYEAYLRSFLPENRVATMKENAILRKHNVLIQPIRFRKGVDILKSRG